MGRLFCYTLSARAIGATVSAGALHAQGWGFESLIAHHLNDKASSNGGLSFWAHRRGIRTRQGAELRKRASVFQRSTQGAKRRSGSGRRSRTRHPSSPTTELETVLERGPFLFGPISWDSNPQGCGAEEARSVFQRSTRGAERRSGCGRRQPHAISLIAHHLFDNGSRKGTVFVWAPRRGIRTRQGAELRKREAFSSAAREGRRPEAGTGGEIRPWRMPLCKKCQI